MVRASVCLCVGGSIDIRVLLQVIYYVGLLKNKNIAYILLSFFLGKERGISVNYMAIRIDSQDL